MATDYQVSSETKLLVDAYRQDFVELHGTRPTNLITGRHRAATLYGTTKDLFRQLAECGVARYTRVRKQVAAERQARLPHINGWSQAQPIVLPQPTGQDRSSDGKTLGPVDRLNKYGGE
jgi:hypothetical protein